MLKCLKKLFALFLKCSLLLGYSAQLLAAQNKEPTYLWGRGLNIPAANLTIGGYADASYKKFDHKPDTAAIDDLSLFITWNPASRLHFFSELEFEDAINSSQGIQFSEKTFLVERLYADFLINETFKLRFGKFLTPVGIWNTIHVAPLVWTTSRPLVTEGFVFPAHANGLMVNGKFIINDHNLDVSVYVDDSRDLDPHKNKVVFKNALGLRINYEILDHLQFGFSYLAYKNQTIFDYSDRNHLLGADLLWKKKGFEIQSEFIYRQAGKQLGNETGLYVQTVAPLGYHFSAIGRYEFLSGTHLTNNILETGTINLGVAGIAWRPYTPLVIKSEYRFGGNNSLVAPSGFFMSISTFF